MALFPESRHLPPPPPPSPIPAQALDGKGADEQPLANIFKEANGQYSYTRVFGAVLTLVGMLVLLFSPAIPQYEKIGYAMIGLGYGGKVAQKPFEK